ncbi:GUN4 domain-containing protein [Spirulina sp. CCNP1310]|uniref:GUN4 domain-containing protein n=1 Tax=Spirulina sp. CCNP1310 TaxID=3110249 RepID=UPI002B212438|nr:GUN4 domain-containing protein [Spirulina sp. CCNP1310]MEA5421356.1 GUN4 domain-containing protein [Spirulina sp. CCNP1310]
MLVTIIIIILFLYFLSVLLNNGDNKKTISTPSPTPSYARLEQFLATEDYRSADLETLDLMMYSVGLDLDAITKDGILNKKFPKDPPRIPCNCLCEIDRLWLTYSQGKFGFSIQAVIYEECQDVDTFSRRVGWYSEDKQRSLEYNELYFAKNAPEGHLPGTKTDLFLGSVNYQIPCRPFRKNVYDCNLPTEYWRNWGFKNGRRGI